jgi:DNA-binding GntR family transcriptional regulator
MYSTLAAETRMILYAYPPYPLRANVEDHGEILEALRAGSPRAKVLLRGHLRYSARLAAEALARGSVP